MGLRPLLLLCSAFFIVTGAHAQKLYKWVDKDGKVSYHDQPPTDAGYRVEEKRIGNTLKEDSQKQVAEKFPVVLYGTPKCSSCQAARAYLRNRGVPFTEKNVEGNRELQDELIKQAGELSVPTIKVGGKLMRGYIESLLEGELDDAGYAKTDATPESSTEESKTK
jgi:glutaredoxin